MKLKILGTNVVRLSLENVSDDELVKLGSYGRFKSCSIPFINKGDSQSASKIITDLS